MIRSGGEMSAGGLFIMNLCRGSTCNQMKREVIRLVDNEEVGSSNVPRCVSQLQNKWMKCLYSSLLFIILAAALCSSGSSSPCPPTAQNWSSSIGLSHGGRVIRSSSRSFQPVCLRRDPARKSCIRMKSVTGVGERGAVSNAA